MTTKPSIALLAKEEDNAGVYGMLSSFARGLKRGLEQNEWDAYYVSDCIKEETKLSLAFNASFAEIWPTILNSGRSHIMWTVDSCFYHNFPIINELVKHPGFHILGLTKTDIEPLNYFFPEF